LRRGDAGTAGNPRRDAPAGAAAGPPRCRRNGAGRAGIPGRHRPPVTPLFAAIGEILVDFTPVVEEGRTVGFRMHAGGSPCNVAVALARMGAEVEFVGQASTDFFGRFRVEYLRRESVGTRYLNPPSAPPTLPVGARVDGGPASTLSRAQAADTLLRPEDRPAGI